MKSNAGLWLFAALSACDITPRQTFNTSGLDSDDTGNVAVENNGSQPKILEIESDVPSWMTSVSNVRIGRDLGNAVELGRVYIDGVDVGSYEIFGSTTISVPGNGSVFQLRNLTNAGLDTTAQTNEVDISRFAPGSRIKIHCVYRIRWSGRAECTPSLIEKLN